MDALGKSLAIVMAVAAVICIVPVLSDTADAAGEMDGLMLYEVNPFDNEGVSVYNYGNSSVDLKNYKISDNIKLESGEGYINFTQSITVKPGTFVVIAQDSGADSLFTDRDGIEVYYIGSNGIETEGRFELANGGDEVFLFRGDSIVDAVCYGSKLIDDPQLWASDYSFSQRTDTFFQRQGTYDTDSEDDWFNYVPGLTNKEFDPENPFTATVTPFMFPNDGGIPIYQALQSADKSIYITMYQLTNRNVYALLSDILENNEDFDMKLLIEGDSLGRDIEEDVPYLKMLVDKGAEVRLIGVADGSSSNRFDYVHAKYAVIDSETVVVTSENWTGPNLNGHIDDDVYRGDDGNRGWGAVIDSVEYAEYMTSVFQMDYSTSYGDVKNLADVFPNAVAADDYDFVEPENATFTSYQNVSVVPVLSNDNSYEALEYYFGLAEERLYAQQQSLSSSYMDFYDGRSPVSLMNQRANDGVDCKLMLDDSVTSADSVVYRINSSTSVEAAVMDSNPNLHNKGIIADDYVWVSSVNWTPTSFHENRECCVVIQSAAIADYYAEEFIQDFYRDFDFYGFSVDISEIQDSYVSGIEATFSVSVAPEGDYTYIWDFGDGSEPFEDLSRVAYTPIATGDGESRQLTVTVVNSEGERVSVSKTYFVGPESVVPPEDPDVPGDTETDETIGDIGELISDNLYILAPLIVIILGAIAAVSRSGSKKRSAKKRK